MAQEFDDIYESTLNRHAPLMKTKIRPHYQKGLSKKTLQFKSYILKIEFLFFNPFYMESSRMMIYLQFSENAFIYNNYQIILQKVDDYKRSLDM